MKGYYTGGDSHASARRFKRFRNRKYKLVFERTSDQLNSDWQAFLATAPWARRFPESPRDSATANDALCLCNLYADSSCLLHDEMREQCTPATEGLECRTSRPECEIARGRASYTFPQSTPSSLAVRV